jgi:uncharacterized membrane protein YheB (UPF0754 family)
MLFRPIKPTKYLGFIKFQGLLHAQREKITADYARILAEDLFAPDILFDGILKGPGADKLFSMVAREVELAIDNEVGGFTGTVVKFAVGTSKYNALKDRIVDLVVERLPATLLDAQDYAMSKIDLERTIIDKMNQLSNEEYESILRPVFKDDEPLMIAIGAILGGCVGELQVLMIEFFTH